MCWDDPDSDEQSNLTVTFRTTISYEVGLKIEGDKVVVDDQNVYQCCRDFYNPNNRDYDKVFCCYCQAELDMDDIMIVEDIVTAKEDIVIVKDLVNAKEDTVIVKDLVNAKEWFEVG